MHVPSPNPYALRSVYAEKYAEDQGAFFEGFTKAMQRMADMGVEWDGAPVTL